MSVIVKEINMPRNCDDCTFCIKDYDYDEGFCSASDHIRWHHLINVLRNHRHPDCPLIEILNKARVIIDIQPTIFEEEEND